MHRHAFLSLSLTLLSLLAAEVVHAGTTAQRLPFAQDWSNKALITKDGDWSTVPGIVGYRGDGLVAAAGTDPQTIVADGDTTPLSVFANKVSATLATGGLAEFELTNPTVAFQPSGTADAPHLVLALDARRWRGITVSYTLRDLDASPDNAVQPVALQYRIGASGDFTNVRAAFIADATTGPGIAAKVTRVSARLPVAANGRPLVQVRVITANASGFDEWVGVDDIRVTAIQDTTPPTLSVVVAAQQSLEAALETGISARVTIDEAGSLRSRIRLPIDLAERLGLPIVVGRATRLLAVPGTVTMVTRFDAAAAAKLASEPEVQVTLRIVAADTVGNAILVDRTVLLNR
jgi:hypothetical protein